MSLTALNLSSSTLLPLGLLIFLYNIYYKEQAGGRVVLPAKFFNPSKTETYVENPSHSGESFPDTNLEVNMNSQKGGTRLITGTSIPPNVIQNVDQVVRGQNITHDPTRFLTYYNNEMQISDNSGVFNSSVDVLKPNEINVTGIAEQNIPDSTATLTIGPSKLELNSGTTEPSVTSSQDLPGYEKHPAPVYTESIVPPSMAGGGSDWASSQLSRGAVNSPGMDENQFRMFTNTAEYISNKELSQGAADHWSETSGSNHSTLYENSVHNGEPSGYNVNGEPVSQYGGDSSSSEYMVEGTDGSMGSNELNFDKRIGFADVETSSFKNRASGGGNSKGYYY